MSSIENFTYNGLDHQLILSIQGNWPLIGEIGSLLWEVVACYQNALPTYLNTSNQILFKVLLFNYLYICFRVELLNDIIISPFSNFQLSKKLQITIQNTNCKIQVEESIFNDVWSTFSQNSLFNFFSLLCNGLKISFWETLYNHLYETLSCFEINFF